MALFGLVLRGLWVAGIAVAIVAAVIAAVAAAEAAGVAAIVLLRVRVGTAVAGGIISAGGVGRVGAAGAYVGVGIVLRGLLRGLCRLLRLCRLGIILLGRVLPAAGCIVIET